LACAGRALSQEPPQNPARATPSTPTVPAATARESRIVAEEGDYRIGTEDVLDISVWKAPELSRTVPVRPDGKVSLPLFNAIHAAGPPPRSLRGGLASR